MLRSWRGCGQEVWRGLHGHQIKALAEAAFAMAVAQNCPLSRMAVTTPSDAKIASQERRWQRLLANERLSVEALAPQWAREVLAEPGRLLLAIDETPQVNHLRAMKLSRIIRGRAVPLLWHVYRPHELPMSQPTRCCRRIGGRRCWRTAAFPGRWWWPSALSMAGTSCCVCRTTGGLGATSGLSHRLT